jgi:hypothetical protein
MRAVDPDHTGDRALYPPKTRTVKCKDQPEYSNNND